MSVPVNRGATRTALRRAREYYAIEMPDAMWAELAASLGRDEHRYLGADGRGTKRYAVQLLRDDGKTLTIVCVYDPSSQCIVTVFAPGKPGREFRAPRRKGKRRAPRSPGRDCSIDPNDHSDR